MTKTISTQRKNITRSFIVGKTTKTLTANQNPTQLLKYLKQHPWCERAFSIQKPHDAMQAVR